MKTALLPAWVGVQVLLFITGWAAADTGAVPTWLPWLVVGAAVVGLSVAAGWMFARLGALAVRAELTRRTVGAWRLGRGGTVAAGKLLVDQPGQAALFIHPLYVDLDEETGEAPVEAP